MKILSFFLKAGVMVVVRMSAGRLFEAVGPATLDAHSPNLSDVRRTSREQGVLVS